MTNTYSTNQGRRKKRESQGCVKKKGDASDGTLNDAEAAIHLTAAFA